MAPVRAPLTKLNVAGLVIATAAASALPFVATSAAADSTAVNDRYGATELARAEQTGVPVDVTGLTDETSQVTAEPNGQFLLTASRGPVRAMTANGWASIDTTLSSNSDGSVSPNVTTVPLRFGAGGGTLMASIGTGQLGINDYWPTTLPAPVLAGDTATYPNVRPNVDLVLTAQGTGFSEALVVKSHGAAMALKAAPIVLNAVGNGVSVTQNADGSITGSDRSGKPQFGAPAPAAWDSSVLSGDPNEHATALQAANAHVAPMGRIASAAPGGTHIALTVPDALLNSASTVYPVYVDPNTGDLAYAFFRTVQSGGWNYNDPTSEPMRVGYCGWSGCTSVEGNARSYFDFNTTSLNNAPTIAHVYSATVKVYETWNAMSGATNVNLTKSGAVSSSTTYPGPVGSTLQTDSSNCGWNNANYCYLTFNNSNVTAYAQDAANSNWSTLTFALSAPAENDASYWKKFSSSSSQTILQVYYNYPPSTPFNVALQGGVRCPGKPVYTSDTTPTVQAEATSYDGSGSRVGLHFQLVGHPIGAYPTVDNQTATLANSNTVGAWNVTPQLSQAPYSLRAYAQTESPDTTNLNSAWSGYTDFTVDATPPSQPSVSSFRFPNDPSGNGYWGATANQSGSSFTLKSSTDAAGFTYAFDTGAAATLPSTQCSYALPSGSPGPSGTVAAAGGAGTLPLPPGFFKTSGYHTLDVRSFDDAHNLSTDTKYSFYVSPDPSGTTTSFIEAETLPVALHGTTTGYTYIQSQSSDSGGQDTELVRDSASTAQSFDLTVKPAAAGYYALGVQLLTGGHNAVLGFQINGKPLLNAHGDAISQDTCSTSPGVPAGTVFVPLGGVHMDPTDPSTYTLTVTMTTTNCPGSGPTVYTGTPAGSPAAGYNDNGYSAGVDDVILAPLNGIVSGNLQDTFNNHGIGVDGATSNLASLDQTTDPVSGYNALSQTALSGIGFTQSTSTQTNTFTVAPANGTGPVTFTLQAAKNNNDNVVAAGQTITMNNQVVGTYASPGYVDLLVGSTCGDVRPSASHLLGMTFTNASSSSGTDNPQPNLDLTVPNFSSAGAATGPTTLGNYLTPITTPYYLTSATSKRATDRAGTQVPATLYLLQAPIPISDYNNPLQSITLPMIGTDFTNTCDSNNNALHVFAVTTSPN